MKFFNNKPAAIIAALGLLLGVSIAKIYQQRLLLQDLQENTCHHPHHHQHDCGENVLHIEIPDIEIPDINIPDFRGEDFQEEFSLQQKRLEAEMERLQHELQQMERQEHFEVQHRSRRAE